MSWNPLRQPVNFALIDATRTPGICRFESDGYRNEVEIKKVKNSFGAYVVLTGQTLPDYVLTCDLFTDEHWVQYYALRSTLDGLPTSKTAKARSVVHPQVQELGITASTYLGRRLSDAGKGKWQVELFFQRWAKSQPTQSRIDGANGTARQGKEVDEQDLQIERLKRQIDELEAETAGA